MSRASNTNARLEPDGLLIDAIGTPAAAGAIKGNPAADLEVITHCSCPYHAGSQRSVAWLLSTSQTAAGLPIASSNTLSGASLAIVLLVLAEELLSVCRDTAVRAILCWP